MQPLEVINVRKEKVIKLKMSMSKKTAREKHVRLFSSTDQCYKMATIRKFGRHLVLTKSVSRLFYRLIKIRVAFMAKGGMHNYLFLLLSIAQTSGAKNKQKKTKRSVRFLMRNKFNRKLQFTNCNVFETNLGIWGT